MSAFLFRTSAVFLFCLFCTVPFDAFSIAAEIYVSPSGDDANSGDKSAPLASLDAARQKARTFAGKESVRIIVANGKYVLAAPLVLTKEDSGTKECPIIYEAENVNGEVLEKDRPVLIHARFLNGETFTAVSPETDPENAARFSGDARKNVLFLDLSAHGFKNIGPWKSIFSGGGDTLQLYFDGRRATMARWPNEEPTTMKMVIANGEKGKTKPIFEFRDKRHTNWPVEKGVWLQGYWRVAWQCEAIRVEKIDADTNQVTFSEVPQNGIGSKYKRPQGSGQEPYWVVNLLEELDTPGEWCIDFQTKRLYFWPPKPITENNLMISDEQRPAISLSDVSHVTFRNFRLIGGLGNAVELKDGTDCTLEQLSIRYFGNDGIWINGGSNHLVQNCRINNIGGGGIDVNGGDRQKLVSCAHKILDNEISDFGQIRRVYAAGIQAGFGRGVGTAQKPSAVGIHIANNLIHDAPHAGILFGGNNNIIEYNDIYNVCSVSDDMGCIYTTADWTSRGNIVRFNYLHESAKAHGVYCDDGDSGDLIYGNVCFRVDSGIFIGGGHDNIVKNNVMIECLRGIHLDARGTSRGYVKGENTLTKTVLAMNYQESPWSEKFPEMLTILDVTPELPTGCVFENNLIVNCPVEIDANPTDKNYAGVIFGKNAFFPKAMSKEELETFPNTPKNVKQEYGEKDFNMTKNSKKSSDSATKGRNKAMNQEPGANLFIDYSQRDFRLKPSSPLFKEFPKFDPIPFEKMVKTK
ncbi:MAG: right-handed parallel beta-helix repeat-containing protein [Thermoguttaceae bacterium]